MLAFCFCGACEEWTEPEVEVYELSERTDAYYADLRLWKATFTDRQVSHGWFGGWNGEGTSLMGSLAGLPDSMDIVSIWGNWRDMTDARNKDLEFVRKVKGTKVVATLFTQKVGQGLTPDGEDVNEYWGWDASTTAASDEPDEAQQAAIRKYALAIVDALASRGYDGLDIDFEGSGDLYDSPLRWKVFVEELGKHLGPQSGTDKLLILDYFSGFGSNGSLASYYNYFIQQVYSWQVSPTLTNWETRVNTLINGCASDSSLTAAEVVKKYIITDSFEDGISGASGGRPFVQEDGETVPAYRGMAAWEPLVNGVRYAKGGCGVYHIEYAYSVPGQTGFYPFTRQAIQIMNPAVIKKVEAE